MIIPGLPLTGAGTPTILFVGFASDTAAGTDCSVDFSTLTGGIASSPRVNDFAVALGNFPGKGSGSPFSTLISSGWTELYQNSTGGATSSVLNLAHKKITSLSGSDLTATWDTGGNSNFTSHGIVAVFRNVDETTPLDVALAAATHGNTAIADPPSVTPVTDGAVILIAGNCTHTASTRYLSHSTFTEIEALGSTGPSTECSTYLGYYTGWTSGAYDPAAMSFSASDHTDYSANSATLVMRPKTT